MRTKLVFLPFTSIRFKLLSQLGSFLESFHMLTIGIDNDPLGKVYQGSYIENVHKVCTYVVAKVRNYSCESRYP